MTWTPVSLINYGAGADTAPIGAAKIDNLITPFNTIKGDYVDPRDFSGWDTTGVNPVDAILQSVITQALSSKLPIRLPKGLYLLNNTVHLAPNQNATDSLNMFGDNPAAFTGNPATFSLANAAPSVIFKANFNNAPAFSVTGCRNLHLANFSVIGLNTPPQYQLPSNVKSNYILAGMRDSQYSPYCGLAVDAFNTATPADGGYPTLASYYNAAASGCSNALIENVTFGGFVVGIGHNLSGLGSLSDSFTYYRCNVTLCDTLVAVGQAQAKICIFLLGNYGNARQGFDGVNYGAGQGIPIPMYGLNFGYLQRIFNYQDTFGPLFLHDCYGESIRSIGNYGTGGSTSRGQMTIQNMQLTMHEGNAGPLPPIMLETYGITSLRNLNIGLDNGTSNAWNFVSDLSVPITLDTCTLRNSVTQIPPIVGATTTGTSVRLVNCLSVGTGTSQPYSDDSTNDVSNFAVNNRFSGSLKASRYANGTGEVFYQSPNTTGTVTIAATSITQASVAITFTASLLTGQTSATLTGNWTNQTGWYNVTFSNAQVILVTLVNGSTAAAWGQTGLTSNATTSATVSNVTLTFTATTVALVQVNDLIFWRMILQGGSVVNRVVLGYAVSSIVSSAVTCIPIFDATQHDTVANYSGVNGNLTAAQIQWAPTVALTCTTTNTSTSLTLVSPTNLLLNGDWVQGTGIPANTRVVSGAGTATIILSQAATASAAGINLYFGRFQTPTVSPTW